MKLYNLKQKYNALNISVKAALWFAVCNAVSKISVLICTPIYTRILTSEQYGEYAVWHSWSGIIAAFTTLNLYNSSYIAGITRYENDKDNFTFSMIGLTTTLSFFSVLLYTWLKGSITFQSKYIYALLIETLFAAYFNFWAAYTRYFYKYIKLLHMVFFNSLFIILGTTGLTMLVPQQKRLDMRIFSEVFIWVITGGICFIILLRKSRLFYDKKYWSFAFKQNIPLIPHYLSATLLNQSDRIMIGEYCGKTKAAYYNLAYTISFMILVVTNAIKSSLDPYFYQAIKKGKGIEQLNKKINQILIAVIFFCSIGIAIAPEMIKIFAPPDYYEAKYVVPPITTSVFFIFAYNIFSCVEFYYGKTKHIMLISCVGALVNIGLNMLLIPVYGYYLAGYTTLFSYVIFAFGHLGISWKLAKANNLGKIYNIPEISFLFALSLIIMVGYVCLYECVLLRYLTLVVVILLIIKRRVFHQILNL